MSYHNTQRLFALLTAVLVVCSFLAAPAAAGASHTVDWDDDLDSSNSSGDSTDTDSESDDSDDESSDDTNDTADSEDTDDDSGDTDSSTDDSSEEDDDTTDSVRDTVDDTTDAVDDTTDAVDDTVGDSTDSVDETVGTTTGTADSTVDDTIETLALEASFTTPSTTDQTDTTYLRLATDSPLQLNVEEDTESTTHTRTSSFRVAAANADTTADGDAVAMATNANAGGGQPLPSAPTGGAAISLSLLAAMAALRSTPLAAGSLPSLSSIGAGISTPAILSKLRPFFFPLRYSRYDDSDPLEHDAREEVYEIVNESPGSYLSEVSEEADLPLSTTRHHIKVLEREDLVSGAKLRGKRRFYPAYAEGVELAAALNDEATASIIDAIARLGAASVSDLADDIGRDPSTISHHLQRLEEDGIIKREREGRAVMNKLTGEARTALEPDSTPKPGEASGAVAGGAD